jgi:hypothetical protein
MEEVPPDKIPVRDEAEVVAWGKAAGADAGEVSVPVLMGNVFAHNVATESPMNAGYPVMKSIALIAAYR